MPCQSLCVHEEAFGRQAHLIQFDYGTFADALRKHGTIMFSSEFIDLIDGKIFWFKVDGNEGKLA